MLNDELTMGNQIFRWGSRTYVMGVLNVTPDSFSGDGIENDIQVATNLAILFEQHGADIIDVGGESTRPSNIYSGSHSVTCDEELSRIIPVICAIREEISIPISVDTRKATVAKEAIKHGASMVNDVGGMNGDPMMLRTVAELGTPLVLMHNGRKSKYEDLIPEILGELKNMMNLAELSGIATDNIIIDPGMGFGKTARHNMEILRRLDDFQVLGRPILVGMSRKSTIGYVLGLPPNDRLEGTAATVAVSIAKGADIVRVHDVKEMVRVARMSDAIIRGYSFNVS